MQGAGLQLLVTAIVVPSDVLHAVRINCLMGQACEKQSQLYLFTAY